MSCADKERKESQPARDDRFLSSGGILSSPPPVSHGQLLDHQEADDLPARRPLPEVRDIQCHVALVFFTGVQMHTIL